MCQVCCGKAGVVAGEMRWEPVAQPGDDLFWGDKLVPVPHMLSQVVVEQEACAHCSDLLQTI